MKDRAEQHRPVDEGWKAHRVEQIRAEMRTTPAQRLAWLEETLAWLRTIGTLDVERRRFTVHRRPG